MLAQLFWICFPKTLPMPKTMRGNCVSSNIETNCRRNENNKNFFDHLFWEARDWRNNRTCCLWQNEVFGRRRWFDQSAGRYELAVGLWGSRVYLFVYCKPIVLVGAQVLQTTIREWLNLKIDTTAEYLDSLQEPVDQCSCLIKDNFL